MDVYNKDSCKRIIICKYNFCFNDSLISYGMSRRCRRAAVRSLTVSPVDTVISLLHHIC